MKAYARGVCLLVLLGAVAHAQEPSKPSSVPPVATAPLKSAGPIIPLKIQIVISRYQGDKKVSSLPYALIVNTNEGRLDPAGKYIPNNGPARLRTGARIPVLSGPPLPSNQQDKFPNQFAYKDVGTNIDCTARTTEDGRFSVSISIEDSSVYADSQLKDSSTIKDVPAFRSFQSSNVVLLKDGQSTELTVSSDKISGEVTKIEVTATVMK